MDSSSTSSLTSIDSNHAFYDRLTNLLNQIRQSIQASEVKDTLAEAEMRGESAESLKEALRDKYRESYEYLEKFHTRVEVHNQLFNQEMMNDIKILSINGLAKMLWLEITSDAIKFACVKFDGSIENYGIQEYHQCFFNSRNHENSEEIKKYISDAIKEYYRKEFVSQFFEDQDEVKVALSIGTNKRYITFTNQLMNASSPSSAFQEDKVGSNLYEEFTGMMRDLDQQKPFSLYGLLGINISNLTGVNMLKRQDGQKESPFTVNLGFKSGTVVMMPQKIDEKKRFCICTLDYFGNTRSFEEWDVLEPFMTEHERNIFRRFPDDAPDVFDYIATGYYMTHLLRFQIESDYFYMNSQKRKQNLPITMKEYVGFLNGVDVSEIFFDHVFDGMRDKIQGYATFLQNRAALLSALFIIARLENYYYEEVEPALEKDEAPIVKMPTRYSDYEGMKSFHKMIIKRCDKLVARYWTSRKSTLAPKFEFVTHSDAEIYGTCVACLFLKSKQFT